MELPVSPALLQPGLTDSAFGRAAGTPDKARSHLEDDPPLGARQTQAWQHLSCGSGALMGWGPEAPVERLCVPRSKGKRGGLGRKRNHQTWKCLCMQIMAGQQRIPFDTPLHCQRKALGVLTKIPTLARTFTTQWDAAGMGQKLTCSPSLAWVQDRSIGSEASPARLKKFELCLF